MPNMTLFCCSWYRGLKDWIVETFLKLKKKHLTLVQKILQSEVSVDAKNCCISFLLCSVLLNMHSLESFAGTKTVILLASLC